MIEGKRIFKVLGLSVFDPAKGLRGFFHSLYHEMSRTEEMIELQIYFYHFRKVINYNAIGTNSVSWLLK